MRQSTLMGMFGLVAVAMCWALLVVLYRVAATGRVARKLVLLLAVEGVTLVCTPSAPMEQI